MCNASVQLSRGFADERTGEAVGGLLPSNDVMARRLPDYKAIRRGLIKNLQQRTKKGVRKVSSRLRVRRFLAITERVKAKRRLAKLEADLRLAQERSQGRGSDNDNNYVADDLEDCSYNSKQ